MQTQSQLLNTTFALSPADNEVQTIFRRVHKLGIYSILQLEFTREKAPAQRFNIVFDRNWDWLDESLLSLKSNEQQDLNLQEVLALQEELKKRANHPIRRLVQRGREKLKLNDRVFYYLDQLRVDQNTRSLSLAIALQTLIEQKTKLNSRLITVRIHSAGKIQKAYLVILAATNTQPALLLDPSGQWPSLHQKAIENLQFTLGNEQIELLPNDIFIQHPQWAWNEDERMFSLFSDGGKELAFKVLGRTTAEKRFKREHNEILKANHGELVPIEIGFHPYWRRLGHTTLRVGEALYELSSQGWKSHSSGADSARAYIFNNPYFKNQYQKYKRVGMPPISLAVTLRVPRHTAEYLWVSLENLSSMQGSKREKFSLYWNNCNHGIMRVLREAGLPGFSDRGYLGFSSVLSFRRVLLEPKLHVDGCYIYPLPGTDLSEDNLRRWVPRLVYRDNSVAKEMRRAIPSLVWDALIFCADRLGKLVSKLFGVRGWRHSSAYHLR